METYAQQPHLRTNLACSVYAPAALYEVLGHRIVVQDGERVSLTRVRSLRTKYETELSTSSLRIARWWRMRIPDGCV